AAAGALGAAALDHEIRDHAVEVQAVVEAAPGQVDEVGDGQWRPVGEQLDPDGAAVGIKNGEKAHAIQLQVAGPAGGAAIITGFLFRPPCALPARHRVRLTRCPNPCPSNACAISPSSPTSTTARPPSSTSCSSSPAPWTSARPCPNG